MMKKTHREFASAWWLGVSLAAEAVSVKNGHAPGVHPAAVAIGVYTARFTSSGKTSPDIDHRWAPGPPARNYHWKRHRGFTHRFWFAMFVITPLLGVLPFLGLIRSGVPTDLAMLAFSLPAGWWSHLAGDMIYGRLPFHFPRYVGGRWRWWSTNVGLGWETGGLSETGKHRDGGWRWLPVDPAAWVCLIGASALALGHLVVLAG